MWSGERSGKRSRFFGGRRLFFSRRRESSVCGGSFGNSFESGSTQKVLSMDESTEELVARIIRVIKKAKARMSKIAELAFRKE